MFLLTPLLPLVFVIGFVVFGVGSDAGVAPHAGDGGRGGDSPFEGDINDAQDQLEANPNDTAALAELVGLYYQSGTLQLEVDETTGQTALTSEAEEEFRRAADAWGRYLEATKGKNVDSATVLPAVQTFAVLGQSLIAQAASSSGQAALDDARDAMAAFREAGAAQLLVDEDPGIPQLAQAAQYFYLGGDVAAGDRAAQEARAEATGRQAEQLARALAASKQQGEQLNRQVAAFRRQLD